MFEPFGFGSDEFLLSHHQDDDEKHPDYLDDDVEQYGAGGKGVYHDDLLNNGGRERKQEREQHEELDHEDEVREREQLTHLADGRRGQRGKDRSLDSKSSSILFNSGTSSTTASPYEQQQQQHNLRMQSSLGDALMQKDVTKEDSLSATSSTAGSNDDTRGDDTDDAKRRQAQGQGSDRVGCGEAITIGAPEQSSSVDHSSNGRISVSGGMKGDPGSRHCEIDEGAGDEIEGEGDDEEDEEGQGGVAKCLQLTVETETLTRRRKEGGREGPSCGIENGSGGGRESGTLSVPTCKWSSVAVGASKSSSSSSHANSQFNGSFTPPSSCTTSPTFLCGRGRVRGETEAGPSSSGDKDTVMKTSTTVTSKGTVHPVTSSTLSSSMEKSSQVGITSFSSASGLSGGSGGAQADFGNLFLGRSPPSSSSSKQQVRSNNGAMDMDMEEDGEKEGEGGDMHSLRETSRDPYTSTSNNINTTNKKRRQQQQQSAQRGVVTRLHHDNKKRFGDTSETPHDNNIDTASLPLAVVSLFSSLSPTSMSPGTSTLDRFDSAQEDKEEQEGGEEVVRDGEAMVAVQKKQETNNKRRAITR